MLTSRRREEPRAARAGRTGAVWGGGEAREVLTLQPPLTPQLQFLLLGQNGPGVRTWGQSTWGERSACREGALQQCPSEARRRASPANPPALTAG